MSGQSLEMERQAILDRMAMRRERYRLMLTDGVDLDDAVVVEPHKATASPYPATQALGPGPRGPHGPHGPLYGAPGSRTYHRTGYGGARETSLAPRNPVMQVLAEHPFLVALGVAAVVAIGPRRIMRTVATGGTALSAVMASNQTNVDLAGRLLTMVGAYVQGRTKE